MSGLAGNEMSDAMGGGINQPASAPSSSLLLRFARWQVRALVSVWPEESRRWGQALASEAEEIERPVEAVLWAFGGVTVYWRAMASHLFSWLRSPLGTRSSSPIVPGPKRSRLFTVAVLTSAAVLLLLPEGRVAVQTVTASWLAFMPTHAERRTLDKLAARAEKDKDAETLAFVALSPTFDPAPAAQKRTEEFVERTVGLDPTLIWIYGAKNHSAKYYPAQKEWIARLEAADPDNAVPILIEASALADQKLSLSPGHPNEGDFRNLGSDPEWMALMGRAYAAPKYDSYLAKHIRVMRDVWDRDPNLPPDIFLMSLWSHAIPNLLLTRRYAEIELDRAKQALAAGNPKQAETLAQGVATFGARMTASSGTMIEELIGVAVSRMADKQFAAIYTAEGKLDEARRATAHLDELDRVVRQRAGRDEAGRTARIREFQRQAALVQGSVILGGLALICAVVGILSLEVWRNKPATRTGFWRRAVCFAADWGPVTSLVASGTFLVCFLPFQKVLADFRVSSFQPTDEMRISDAMWSLVAVPEYVLGVDSAVAFWSAVTYTLSAIAVGVVAWGIYRARRAQIKPA